MDKHASTMSYALLWDVSDTSDINAEISAYMQATAWPGLPKDPISPVPKHVNIADYGFQHVKPVRDGRRTRRGGGYANLSNYNTIP